MARQRLRFLHKHGLGVHRLEIGDGTAPVAPPLWIQPSSAPSGTAQEGDLYWDDTANAPKFYDGSAQQQIAGLGAIQTWTAAQTFSAAPVFSVAPTGALTKRTVKTGAATLTAAENGALCLFNAAAGFTYTLPTAAAGLWFDFVVTVTVTSSAAKVITASASEFIVGGFLQIPDTAAQIVSQSADGTTIRSWNGNGTTTGGIKGDAFRLTAISATQWAISGIGLATGTEATPFATS